MKEKQNDSYSPTGFFQNFSKGALIFVSLGWVAFQLTSAWMLGFHDMIQQPLHIGFAIAVALMGYSFSGKQRKGESIPIWDLLLALFALVTAGYLLLEHGSIVLRMPFVDEVTFAEKIFGVAIVLLLLEACRRTLGWALTIIAVVAIAYGFIGPFIGGVFGHSGLTISQFVEMQYLTTYGIFGVPTQVSANMVFYFVLVGMLLQVSGGGELFINIAYFLTGRSKGGSAKASIISSSLFGTVSGSAVGNVLVTGLLTIPLMKKTGYPPHVAAAVEASSSTGGQLAPPIMGAAAFLLAQIVGVPYSEVVMAAIVPAALFYLSLFCMADFYSRQHGLRTLTQEERSLLTADMGKRLHLFIPLIYLIYLLFQGSSLMTVGLKTLISIIIVSFFRSSSRMKFKQIIEAFHKGALAAVNVAIPCGVAGVLVGMIVNTGMIPKFKDILIGMTGGFLFPSLLVAMFLSLLLGVGMPTAPAYILSAILIAPTLSDLGVPILAAHLFVFYFAVISMVTPPVALAGFAAAGVAESNMWKTGFMAFKMSLAAFLIPYAFVFQKGLLLMGGWKEIVWAITATSLGIIFLAASLSSYFLGSLRFSVRVFFFISSILMISPNIFSDIIGFSLGILSILMQLYYSNFALLKNKVV